MTDVSEDKDDDESSDDDNKHESDAQTPVPVVRKPKGQSSTANENSSVV
jgi:hypothetical protein